MNDEASEAIRSGLTQYVGALLANSERRDDETAHAALAELSEVWLMCCRKEDGTYDMFAAKPILRAAVILIKQRMEEIKKELAGSGIDDSDRYLAKYRYAVESLEKLVASIKRGDFV